MSEQEFIEFTQVVISDMMSTLSNLYDCKVDAPIGIVGGFYHALRKTTKELQNNADYFMRMGKAFDR
jgi:hypothetical protein